MFYISLENILFDYGEISKKFILKCSFVGLIFHKFKNEIECNDVRCFY